MVDDVLIPVKCNNDSIEANIKINHFIETKKLKLNSTKCHKMHIGKKNESCPNLQVHSENMNSSSKEK